MKNRVWGVWFKVKGGSKYHSGEWLGINWQSTEESTRENLRDSIADDVKDEFFEIEVVDYRSPFIANFVNQDNSFNWEKWKIAMIKGRG